MRDVGAFEAKTDLSELLAAVEAGEEIRITRRGKAVARLVPDVSVARARHLAAVEEIERLRETLRGKVTVDEILAWKNEGRR